MSARGLIDVGPLGRLLFRPRAALGASALLVWVLGLGWAGLALRLHSLREGRQEAPIEPLLLALGLTMIPAAFGAIASEALHEVLRRPTLSLLPGIVRRLRASTLLLALAVALGVAAAFAALQPGLALQAAAGPALLGVAVGSWSMLRAGGSCLWIVRLGALVALAGLAQPISALCATSPSAAAAIALVGLVSLERRLRPALLRASLFAGTPSVLTILSAPRSPLADSPVAGDPGLPPARLGGSLAGWLAARRFEQQASPGRMGSFASVLRLAFYFVAIGCVYALISAGIDGESLLARLSRTFLGATAAESAAGGELTNNLVFVLGVGAGMLVWTASVPLVGDFLYPISRAMRARLAARVTLITCLQVLVATLVAGASVSALLVLLAGGRPPRALPVFAWAALANLLAMPWMQIAAHGFTRVHGRAPRLVKLSVIPLSALALGFCLAELQRGWQPLVEGLPSGSLVLGYLALLGAGLAALRAFLGWHFQSCDLVRD